MHKRNGDPFWDWMEGRLPGPPSARHLGWKCLEVNPEQGTMTVEFQPKPEFLNPARGVGGGYLAAMLDETTSPAVKATLEPQQFPSAVEFKVNFIRPAPLGKLIGRARIVHRDVNANDSDSHDGKDCPRPRARCCLTTRWSGPPHGQLVVTAGVRGGGR